MENRPPSGLFDSLKSPQSSSLPTITVPLSPSKRRQASSHYSDADGSPPKKSGGVQSCALLPEERGLLFGPSKSANRVAKADVPGNCFGGQDSTSAILSDRVLVSETLKLDQLRTVSNPNILELSINL